MTGAAGLGACLSGHLVLAALLAAGDAAPRTVRVEYVHSGTAREEHFALDKVVLEGPWPGPPDRRIDESDTGQYLFEVREVKGDRLLYSRGFASIFGEWETTPEARERPRAFHESVRFPDPGAPVKLVLKKRGDKGRFQEAWSVAVDPGDVLADRAPAPRFKSWAVVQNGPPRDKVDLLLLGDGYTAAEMDKWHRDARRMADLLFAVSPFKERRSDFNVWAVDMPSEESGVSRPSDGFYRRSALRATYDAFGSERYVLAFDESRLREAASAAPYEFVEIVVNDRKYGGGGIHNLYATVAADSAWAPYLFVHEFAHHFAGLADEYYTSAVAYETGGSSHVEPWEANATADPRAAKWRDLVTSATPLPTPWEKEAFEAVQKDFQARRRKIRADKRPEEEMDALFREEKAVVSALLAKGPHARRVGAFEGARYEARGLYRPQADCIMFTRDDVGFCAVCRRALERVIDLYATRR